MFYVEHPDSRTTGTPVEYIRCLLIQDDVMHSLLHLLQTEDQYVDRSQPLEPSSVKSLMPHLRLSCSKIRGSPLAEGRYRWLVHRGQEKEPNPLGPG